jgi:hypothetical protein
LQKRSGDILSAEHIGQEELRWRGGDVGSGGETLNADQPLNGSTCIIGFDSAWTDSDKAPGAVCAIVIATDGSVGFKPPHHATFDQALAFIDAERGACSTCLVALDQPTIVPNETGSRPVDRVAGSLISFIGGGVQPANRSKKDMFGDGAPIWRFLKRLGATENPELSRTADSGLFVVEVFPALALRASRPASAGAWRLPNTIPPTEGSFDKTTGSPLSTPFARYAHAVPIAGITDWAETIRLDSSISDRAKGIRTGSTPFCVR